MSTVSKVEQMQEKAGGFIHQRPKLGIGKERRVHSGKISDLRTAKTVKITTMSPLKPQVRKDEDRNCKNPRPKASDLLGSSVSSSANSSPKNCPSTPPSPELAALRLARKSSTVPGLLAQRKLKLNGDGLQRKQKSSKAGKIVPEGMAVFPAKTDTKKRCAWITSQSDSAYVAYHDEEWGVPTHDDRKLFELLVLGGAQAEIPWSSVLSKREMYRQAFADFNPAEVASYDEAKIRSLQNHGDILQSDARMRSIVNNAKLVLEITEQFGSFDEYLWGFMSHKSIVNSYRHSNFIPAKTAKSEAISKDLQKRGFRHAGPMVVYTLMQAAGMTNDHLVHCFRHQECKKLQEIHHQSPKIRPKIARKPHKSTESCIFC